MVHTLKMALAKVKGSLALVKEEALNDYLKKIVEEASESGEVLIRHPYLPDPVLLSKVEDWEWKGVLELLAEVVGSYLPSLKKALEGLKGKEMQRGKVVKVEVNMEREEGQSPKEGTATPATREGNSIRVEKRLESWAGYRKVEIAIKEEGGALLVVSLQRALHLKIEQKKEEKGEGKEEEDVEEKKFVEAIEKLSEGMGTFNKDRLLGILEERKEGVYLPAVRDRLIFIWNNFQPLSSSTVEVWVVPDAIWEDVEGTIRRGW